MPKMIRNKTDYTFLWYPVIGLVTGGAIGYLVAFLAVFALGLSEEWTLEKIGIIISAIFGFLYGTFLAVNDCRLVVLKNRENRNNVNDRRDAEGK